MTAVPPGQASGSGQDPHTNRMRGAAAVRSQESRRLALFVGTAVALPLIICAYAYLSQASLAARALAYAQAAYASQETAGVTEKISLAQALEAEGHDRWTSFVMPYVGDWRRSMELQARVAQLQELLAAKKTIDAMEARGSTANGIEDWARQVAPAIPMVDSPDVRIRDEAKSLLGRYASRFGMPVADGLAKAHSQDARIEAEIQRRQDWNRLTAEERRIAASFSDEVEKCIDATLRGRAPIPQPPGQPRMIDAVAMVCESGLRKAGAGR